jgi:hypothetical protein
MSYKYSRNAVSTQIPCLVTKMRQYTNLKMEEVRGHLRQIAALYFPSSPTLTFEKRAFIKEKPLTIYTSH